MSALVFLVPRLPGQQRDAAAPYRFELSRGGPPGDVGGLQIPITNRGPESDPVFPEQSEWVFRRFSALECVFAGAWRIHDESTWQRLAETLAELEGGPSAELRQRLAELEGRSTEPQEREADLRDFDALIADAPDWPAAWVARAARRYLVHHDYTGSARDAEHATTLQPVAPQAWYYLGCSRWSAHDLAGADAAFERATALAPDNLAWLQAYGTLLAEAEQHARAIDAFRRAAPGVKRSPSSLFFGAMMGKGRSHAALGQVDAALRAFRDAKRCYADSCVPDTAIARLLWCGEGGAAAALPSANDAVALAQDYDVEPFVARGGVLRRLGQFEPALADLDEALRRNPAHGAALAERALVLATIKS